MAATSAGLAGRLLVGTERGMVEISRSVERRYILGGFGCEAGNCEAESVVDCHRSESKEKLEAGNEKADEDDGVGGCAGCC